METMLIILILGTVVVGGIVYFATREKKKDETAAVQPEPTPETYEDRVPAHLKGWPSRRSAVGTPAPYTPSPTVVHHDSGMSPLLAGMIGYAIGSSGSNSNHHSHDSAPDTSNIGTCPAPSSDDSSSSYLSSDSGSSSDYSSSSSDSGSSYSSDSGGGGSFGSD